MKRILWVVSVFSILIFVGVGHSHPGYDTTPKFYSDSKPSVSGCSEYQMGSKPQESIGKLIHEGREIIEVPAGTITAPQSQYLVLASLVDPWVSRKDVSPYGLIKLESKVFRMVVTGEEDDDDHDGGGDGDGYGDDYDSGDDDESSDSDGD